MVYIYEQQFFYYYISDSNIFWTHHIDANKDIKVIT